MGPGTESTTHVLLVGTGPVAHNLESLIAGESWRCSRLDTTSGAIHRLRTKSDIDVVLLAPDREIESCAELCRHIKFDSRTAFMAVVFVLSPEHADCRSEVFAASADECIQLPAPSSEIIQRITNACRVKRTADSLEDATAVITSLANAIEGRDAYTRGHVERVSTYAVQIGQRLGLSADDMAALRIGGVVHDIGKVAVPDHVLNKRGKLNEVEFAIVRLHPIVGHDILQPLRSFQRVLPIVRWHHERPNGRGYPDGLRDEQLPLLPRIVAAADVFDAISTARSYRPAFAPEKCRDILHESAESGDLDADVVATLLEIFAETSAALAETAHPS